MPRSFQRKQLLADVGSTGNNTHSGVEFQPGDDNQVGFEFEVEAVGATPTVTYKYQGSTDNTNWYDVLYVTDSTDTASAATRAATAVSKQIQFLSKPSERFYRYFRLVTSANTNVTYSAQLITDSF